MPKLIMMSGLPGSGKSTEARRIVKDQGPAGRVNRDDLREMLFNSVWTGKREAAVIDIEKAIAKVLLQHGMSPVVDDTNLTPKHRAMWEEVAKSKGMAFEVRKMDTPIGECMRRDFLRDKQVGAAVIWRTALMAGMIQWPDKPIAIVDIDGTLSDGSHREAHVAGPGKKDWKRYFSLMSGDKPVDFVCRWVRELAKTHTIAIVSGRPDTYAETTHWWLKTIAQVPFDFLFMRPGSDSRQDTEIKQMILDAMPKEKIALVIDDRPSVVRMWKSNGLKVIPVRGAVDEF